MRCPMLSELPEPPQGRTGWPWTEESPGLEESYPAEKGVPKISIVTPVYDQEMFIEETIRSVLLQGYPDIEYIVIDDGSTDGSASVIKKYEQWIDHWYTQDNSGQTNALNRGFRAAGGALIGWQNSDDYYDKGAFTSIARHFNNDPGYDVYYGPVDNIDAEGGVIRQYPVSDFDINKLIPYMNMANQAMFFKRSVFDNNEYLDENYKSAMDLEFLTRIAVKGYKFKFVNELKGYYRVHKDARGVKKLGNELEECIRIYGSIYMNNKTPDRMKERSIESIKGACLRSFAINDLKVFRYGMGRMFRLTGIRYIDPVLAFKWLVSCFGAGAKNIFKRKT